MDRDYGGRRRIGSAIILGLMALLVGLIVSPAGGHAAATTTAPAEQRWREVLTVDNPAPTLTLREVKQMAERAAGTSVPSSDLSVVVDGGNGVPGALLLRLIDGAGLNVTFNELTGGAPTSQGAVIIVYCNKCTIKSS